MKIGAVVRKLGRTSFKRELAMLTLVSAASAAGAEPVTVRDVPTKEQMAAGVMPALAFTQSPATTQDFEKFFFFHRPETEFAIAYRDIRECDDFARGISFHTANTPVYYPYPYAGTVGGAIGGAIGNAMADAIFGSAQRRLNRRINLRTCMGYKGYDRYGLPKEIWEKFNFEEGNRTVKEDERVVYLTQQAKVASGPTPAQGALPR